MPHPLHASIARHRSIAVQALTLLSSQAIFAAPPTFPGAEGYGRTTTGGRGGSIIEVTNLNDSGTGSLRAAVSGSAAKTVVFRVSGTIALNSSLNVGANTTIAGQTAPGGGITLRNYTLNIGGDNVAIRYLRARYGDQVQVDADAVSMRFRKNLMLDHISASWGDDETMSVYHGQDVTVQWSIVSETLNRGGVHGFAGIWGSPNSTYHHNLLAHNVSRAIRFASGSGNTDYRNNVIYNWDYNSAYGGEMQQPGDPNFSSSTINMVGNYYKPGPATNANVATRIINPTTRNGADDYGKFYVAGNYVVGSPTVTANNWNGGVVAQGGTSFLAGLKLEQPWAALPIAEQTAEQAYLSVLDYAGSHLPNRDTVDTRIINEVRTGTATYGTAGIIESQTQVGGWPTLSSLTAPADADHDGMHDAWELQLGLNPNNASDRNGDLDTDGYTNVEEYLNELGAFPCPRPLIFNGSTNTRFALSENWSYDWQPSRLDTAYINGGVAVVDAIGQTAGSIRISSTSTSGAALHISAGSIDVANSLEVGGPSSVGNSTLQLSGGRLRVFGLLSTSTGSSSLVLAGGTLVANQIIPSGLPEATLVNVGTNIAPGDITSVGKTRIDGNYRQEALAKLSVNLAGSVPATAFQQSTPGFDVLEVAGFAELGGELSLTRLNGYAPAFLVPHRIISAGSISGAFDHIAGVQLSDVFGLAVSYDAQGVFVTTTMLGDANIDGIVDFSDLLTLAQNYTMTGTGWTSGDFDGNGTTGFEDLLSLAQHYEATPTGNLVSDWRLAQTLAPEPGTIFGTIASLSLLAGPRRRRLLA